MVEMSSSDFKKSHRHLHMAYGLSLVSATNGEICCHTGSGGLIYDVRRMAAWPVFRKTKNNRAMRSRLEIMIGIS